MRLPVDLVAIARLEVAEVRRSRWLPVCLGLYAGLAALFVLVGLRESRVLGFTGMGRVLFSLTHALVFLLPLIALAVTGQTVNRAREDGTLELLLTQPVDRGRYLAAVAAVRTAALVAPLLVLLVVLAAGGAMLGMGAAPLGLVARAAAVSTALLFCFAAVGVLLSTLVRSPARAMTYLLLTWMASVALLDLGLIGLLLQWRLPPRAVFLLAALNPVQDARLALLSALETDLATLGPVGFWIATRVGREALLALGVGWPLVAGAGAFALAWLRFRRDDLI
ncbi:MAG: ABC transporter permease [Myxococcota bacterium]|nr:ABC transporter permease [Myxococcota bacterium]